MLSSVDLVRDNTSQDMETLNEYLVHRIYVGHVVPCLRRELPRYCVFHVKFVFTFLRLLYLRFPCLVIVSPFLC